MLLNYAKLLIQSYSASLSVAFHFMACRLWRRRGLHWRSCTDYL